MINKNDNYIKEKILILLNSNLMFWIKNETIQQIVNKDSDEIYISNFYGKINQIIKNNSVDSKTDYKTFDFAIDFNNIDNTFNEFIDTISNSGFKKIYISNDFDLCNLFEHNFIMQKITETLNKKSILEFSLNCHDLISNDIINNDQITYIFSNIVIDGKKLGRKIGYRTANLSFKTPLLIKPGVYIDKLTLNGNHYYGMGCYIGWNDQTSSYLYETHILNNFENDFYNETLTVTPLVWLRNNKKINSLQELKDLLAGDKEQTIKWITKLKEKGS